MLSQQAPFDANKVFPGSNKIFPNKKSILRVLYMYCMYYKGLGGCFT